MIIERSGHTLERIGLGQFDATSHQNHLTAFIEDLVMMSFTAIAELMCRIGTHARTHARTRTVMQHALLAAFSCRCSRF
jgi:hypothetical protein